MRFCGSLRFWAISKVPRLAWTCGATVRGDGRPTTKRYGTLLADSVAHVSNSRVSARSQVMLSTLSSAAMPNRRANLRSP